jgi:hypothetical protein
MNIRDLEPKLEPEPSSTELMVLSGQTLALTPHAPQLRSMLLEISANVLAVADADEQKQAVAVQAKLASTLKLVETCRKQIKEKVDIDKMARNYREPLEKELSRISNLIADFQQLEAKKARAAEQAENDRLTRLERERAAAETKATSHEELDSIAEEFNNRAKDEAIPVAAPARVEGQVIKEDFDVIVSDIHALYRAYPYCVRLEPLIGQIKTLLHNGTTRIPGVRAEPIVRASVRTKQPAILDI